jgi:hypothetical protein
MEKDLRQLPRITDNENETPTLHLHLQDHQTPDTLTLPMSEQTLSESALSMRTSSFALSDISDPNQQEKVPPEQQNQQHLESLRIRKAYSQPPRSTWRTPDHPFSETENVDYFDEKDFRNTDRYLSLSIIND